MKGFVVLVLTLSSAASVAVKDVEGSKDHDLIGRYGDFYIEEYQYSEYDEAEVMVSVFDQENDKAENLKLEGKVTNIQYWTPNKEPKASMFQIFKNYEKLLKGMNAEFLLNCRNEACYLNETYDAGVFINSWIRSRKNMLKGFHPRVVDDFGLMTAKVTQDGGQTIHVMLSIGADHINKQRIVSMSIIESETMNTEKIKVITQDDIEKEISKTGKMTLDGIYFDHDKATIKAESNETLDVITNFLKASSGNFFVVGHTDNSGAYDYNINLSKARAKSVVAALIERGISTSKLSNIGIGPVSPKAPNSSEDGMALNRRVELVLK